MNRTDANSIALRAVRAILAATPSSNLQVGARTVRVQADVLPATGWPRTQQGTSKAIAGLDEERDGPWPPAVRLACSWEAGGTILTAQAAYWSNASGTNHHHVGLTIRAPDDVELLWVTFPNQIAKAKDGDAASITAWASIRSRQGDPPGQSRKLNAQLLEQLDATGLPRTTGPSMVELCAVRVPDGVVEPSRGEALDRAIQLALLKLPILGRDRNACEGAPLFVPNLAGPSQPPATPLSSDAKRAAIYMLPGGVREYKQTLDELLAELADGPMPTEALDRIFRERYEITGQSALSAYRSFLFATGLAELDAGTVRLTNAGADYLIERDALQLFELLDARFTGVLETLVVTARRAPAPLDATAEALRHLLGTAWQSTMQPMVRRNWLLSLGLTEREPEGDAPTELGRAVLARRAEDVAAIAAALDAAPPMPAAAPEPDEDEPAKLPAARVDLTPELVRPHLGKLALPSGVLETACAALSCGNHLLLVGPPGTGKTELAMALGLAARMEGACDGIRPSTASADWTTFETIGGYALEPAAGGEALVFRPGVFLQAVEAGQWLLIDELNRADVDRAFGELMTVLSGKGAILPYRDAAGLPISVGKEGDPHAPKEGWSHPLPPTFRLIATMNTWDKTSLFRLSFALQRRFAILHVGLPDDETYAEVLRAAAEAAGYDEPLAEPVLARVVSLFSRKGLLAHVALGPAIGLEVVRYLRRRRGAPEAMAEAIGLYVLPQLEGLARQQALAVRAALHKELEGWTPAGARSELDERFAELHPEVDA